MEIDLFLYYRLKIGNIKKGPVEIFEYTSIQYRLETKYQTRSF